MILRQTFHAEQLSKLARIADGSASEHDIASYNFGVVSEVKEQRLTVEAVKNDRRTRSDKHWNRILGM